jgi:hypothetical protein
MESDMHGECMGHGMGHVWGVYGTWNGTCMGSVWDIEWDMYGECMGHGMGAVWGV